MIISLLYLFVLLTLSTVVYFFTKRWLPDIPKAAKIPLVLVSFFALCIWLLFDLWYFHFYDDWAWLTALRAFPGIEIISVFTGVGAAYLQTIISQRNPPKDAFSANNGLLLCWLMIIPIFIKPVLFSVEPYWRREWKDGVCLQSEGYTCGPASTATILKYLGIDRTEEEISTKTLLTKHGTEPWHLVRYIRQQGKRVNIVSCNPQKTDPPTPCIAMIRLGGKMGTGHFLVIYEATENSYLFGNPETGRYRWSKKQAWDDYYFTGLFLHVK